MWNSKKLSTWLYGAALACPLVCNPSTALAAQASYAQTFSNKSASGDELANAFFDLLSHTGSPAGVVGTTPEQDAASKALVRPYLDPAFLLQRASGERYTAQTYLPADVDRFEIGDVRTTRPADGVQVVRYSVRTTQTLPDSALVMSKDKAPRLTVFHWSAADSRWKILSHGNFNTPIAAICDRRPLVDNNLISPASPADQALGEGLKRKFYDLLQQGDAAPMLHPLMQYQTAAGAGYTTLAERKKTTKLPEVRFSRAIVTRNGRLLVASVYHTTATERIVMGEHRLREGKSGNLGTFLLGDDATWRMIALASFVPAHALPAGVECVPSGKLGKAP